MFTRSVFAVVTVAVSLACGQNGQAVDIESVPVGAEVAVVRTDGGVVQGTLTERSPETVVVRNGAASRPVARAEIADVRVVDATSPEPVKLPEAAKFLEYTLPAGTEFSVRLNTNVNSATSRATDPVEAAVITPVMLRDMVLVPAGSILKGEVTAAEAAGKVKGRASLTLRFHTLTIEGHDQAYAIAVGVSQVAPATKADDAAKIGVPAVVGGVIGGILGGKKGAVTGIVIGGGAGTAVVLTTAGEEISLAPGTTLTMRLEAPVDIRVPVARR
jgi:hypothetical protein